MRRARHTSRLAFTLMEMMVSISILLIVILGVAMIFRATSRAVGMSQAALEMFSNVRAFQHQLETDIQSMDRQSFLVIRGRSVGGHRYDQICFVGYGRFPNRTGASSANPYADQTSANAAVVWYGHAVVLAGTDGGGAQNVPLPVDAVPAGNSDADFWLCRHARLLMPATSPNSAVYSADGTAVAAYPTPFWNAPLLAPSSQEPVAHITSSRISAVSLTPAQLAAQVAAGRQHDPRFEADNLCFRFKVLPSIYASEVLDANGRPSLVNASLRMHPILLQGAPEFAVDWADGSVDASGSLRWFGVGAPIYAAPARPGDQLIEPRLANGDDYTALFTSTPALLWIATATYNPGDFVTYGGFMYRALTTSTSHSPDSSPNDWTSVDAPIWPRALRFTYRATDVNNRLEGGRVFVQIIPLN